MVLEYTSSDKDEPQAIPTGSAPTFAADISEFASWLADGRIFRKATTQAALIATTGNDDNDLGIVDNIDGAFFRYDGSVPGWRMHGEPRFATVAARDAAITTPHSGMRCLAGGAEFVYVSGWRLAENCRFADATARDAALTAPALGDLATLTSDEVTYRYNGSAWKAWSSDWITWATAPTNLTVGTGGSASAVQRYKWINGKPFFECKYTLGTSGQSVGTNPAINLPFAIVLPTPNLPKLLGPGSIYDTSAVATTYMMARADTTTTVRLNTDTGTPVGITATAPITFAAGDQLAIEFWGLAA